jgi:DNA polymerase III subunit delta'
MSDNDNYEDDEDVADAPGEVPAPRANPLLLGHETAEARLLQFFAANRLPHGLLITGPHGIGKATLAFRFARFLLAQVASAGASPLFAPASPSTLELPPEHPVFRRTANAGHADLLVVERGIDPKRNRPRTEIVVDDARAIASFLRLTPAEGGWRIVIVDTADDMNRNAANAVLKILEEPPPRALLILVSDNPGRLLPTIRSRCHRLVLRPLSDAILDTLLQRYRPDLKSGDREALMALAPGSIGHALELAEEGGVAVHRQLVSLLEALPDLDGLALHAFAEKVGRWGNDAGFRAFTELLPATLARAISEAAETGHGRQPRSSLAQKLGARSLDRWVQVWEKINELFALADAVNLDRKEVVLNAFFALEEAAR